jgi:hypothetical protein
LINIHLYGYCLHVSIISSYHKCRSTFMLVLCYNVPLNIIFILGEEVSVCHPSSGGLYDDKIVMIRWILQGPV